MDSWVVAPVARWLHRQDPPDPDATVSPPGLLSTKVDEQEAPAGQPLLDTSIQADSSQPVLDSATVNDPVDTLQPPQNEQQRQPFVTATTATVATTPPRAEDWADSPKVWIPASPDQPSRVSCHGRCSTIGSM